MKINLDESVTVLMKRVERLRGLNPHLEVEVRVNLDRVKEALAEVEALLSPAPPPPLVKTGRIKRRSEYV